MKFKTDFMTSCSSSSFLLEEGYNEDKFHQHIAQEIEKIRAKMEAEKEESPEEFTEGDRKYYEGMMSWLAGCESSVRDIGGYDKASIDEMIEWYGDEILGGFQGILNKPELTEAEREKVYLGVLLDSVIRENSVRTYRDTVTAEDIRELCNRLSEKESKFLYHEKTAAFVEEHRGEFESYGRKIAEEGHTYMELAKKFLGCSKGYYVTHQTNMEVFFSIIDFEGCRFGCPHMG